MQGEEEDPVCLSILSGEDVEDVHIIRSVITGFLLFGFDGYWAYREICKKWGSCSGL